MNNNCIEIIGLKYLNLFEDFSVAFEKEKFLTISGSNNCGKTSFIRIIDGQIPILNTILVYGKKYEEYTITEINTLIKSVVPLEFTKTQNTVEEELLYQMAYNTKKEIKQKRLKEIAKQFKLTKFLTRTVENLSDELLIRLQLALAFISSPKIVLIDDLSSYFSKKDLLDITNSIKEINKNEKITIIMITSQLECNLLSDYTYIISNGEIVLEGSPLEVLEKDNILNKAGFNLPFMMDLSVKLRDYDLIKQIELDMDRLVDTLWN